MHSYTHTDQSYLRAAVVIFKLSSTDTSSTEAPFMLTHINNTEGQQNLLKCGQSYKCLKSNNMAIITSGTNSYKQLRVKTVTDGEKMLNNLTKTLFCSTNTANCSVKILW
jgi:hypothetical protein